MIPSSAPSPSTESDNASFKTAARSLSPYSFGGSSPSSISSALDSLQSVGLAHVMDEAAQGQSKPDTSRLRHRSRSQKAESRLDVRASMRPKPVREESDIKASRRSVKKFGSSVAAISEEILPVPALPSLPPMAAIIGTSSRTTNPTEGLDRRRMVLRPCFDMANVEHTPIDSRVATLQVPPTAVSFTPTNLAYLASPAALQTPGTFDSIGRAALFGSARRSTANRISRWTGDQTAQGLQTLSQPSHHSYPIDESDLVYHINEDGVRSGSTDLEAAIPCSLVAGTSNSQSIDPVEIVVHQPASPSSSVVPSPASHISRSSSAACANDKSDAGVDTDKEDATKETREEQVRPPWSERFFRFLQVYTSGGAGGTLPQIHRVLEPILLVLPIILGLYFLLTGVLPLDWWRAKLSIVRISMSGEHGDDDDAGVGNSSIGMLGVWGWCVKDPDSQ